MVVDCGGGTVDVTVYEMVSESGKLKELYMATGGPYGSTGTYWNCMMWTARTHVFRALVTCLTIACLYIVYILLLFVGESIPSFPISEVPRCWVQL